MAYITVGQAFCADDYDRLVVGLAIDLGGMILVNIGIIKISYYSHIMVAW